MKTLIVDDHPVARRGLAAIVHEGVAEVETIVGSSDAGEALRIARDERPELILLDMHMPREVPTRQLCEQLRALLPDSRIVLVTAYERAADIRDCLLAGANGCLLKDTEEADLAESLMRLLDGQTVIDPRVAQKLAEGMAHAPSGRHALRLTAREREVLGLLAQGCSNRQIANTLVISETTVKGYVSSLLDKLDATSRLEAVVRAADAGLI